MPAEKPETNQSEAKAENKIVKNGNKIKLQYTGTLDDGTVFDSSDKHDSPLEFEVGGKQVIKGFEDAAIGMKIGEEKTFKLQSSEAYGDPNPQLVKKVPKSQLPDGGKELKIGMMLGLTLPNGMQVPARIASVDTDTITIDLNHPLAGKALTFKIKILEIN